MMLPRLHSLRSYSSLPHVQQKLALIGQSLNQLNDVITLDYKVQPVAFDPLQLAFRPLRITVLGANKVGKTSLVNSLLGAQVLPASFTDKSKKFTVVRAGNTHADLGVPESSVNRINTAISLLVEHNLEVVDTPGFSTKNGIDSALFDQVVRSSDLLLLLTDVSRQLSEHAELAFVSKLRDKQPLFVLSQIDRMEGQPFELANVIDDIRANLKENGVENPKIFAVSSRKSVTSVQSEGSGGIAQLQKILKSSLANDIKSLYKSRTSTLASEQEITSVLREVQLKKSVITKVENNMESLKKAVESFEAKFSKDFKGKSTSLIQHQKNALLSRVRAFFDGAGFFSLLTDRDRIGLNLYLALYSVPLMKEIDEQVASETGRLTELITAIKLHGSEELGKLAQDSSALNFGMTKSLSDELSTLQKWFAAESTAPLEATALKEATESRVAQFTQKNKPADLQDSFERALFYGATAQVGAFTGFLATFLSNFDQMTLAMGYTGAATLSLVGLAWIKLSWAREKRKLLKEISALYDDVEKGLMGQVDIVLNERSLKHLKETMLLSAEVIKRNKDAMLLEEVKAKSLHKDIMELKGEISALISKEESSF